MADRREGTDRPGQGHRRPADAGAEDRARRGADHRRSPARSCCRGPAARPRCRRCTPTSRRPTPSSVVDSADVAGRRVRADRRRPHRAGAEGRGVRPARRPGRRRACRRRTQGYALLDKQGITTSEFRQRIDYQRALEGELSKTLKAMDGVQSATVHLALPEESVFVDEPTNPTASVMISTQGTGGIGDDQVQAIVHLVASSVKNMQPDGRDRHRRQRRRPVGGRRERRWRRRRASGRTKEQASYEQKVAASILAMLSRTTGRGQGGGHRDRRPRPRREAVDVGELRADRHRRERRRGRRRADEHRDLRPRCSATGPPASSAPTARRSRPPCRRTSPTAATRAPTRTSRLRGRPRRRAGRPTRPAR